MKKLSRILGYILNILIILVTIIIILAIYYFVQIKIVNKPYANIFGYTFFEVATGSMDPTIDVGDVIIVKITNEVNENDIIVCNKDNAFITHRLIKIEEDNFITKGDANNTADPMVVRDFQVEGKVMNFSIPELGKYLYYFYTDQILIIIVFAFLILDFLVNIFSQSKSKQEKKQIEIKEREEIEII